MPNKSPPSGKTAPFSQARTHEMNLRLSIEENERLQAIADHLGIGRSSVIRLLVMREYKQLLLIGETKMAQSLTLMTNQRREPPGPSLSKIGLLIRNENDRLVYSEHETPGWVVAADWENLAGQSEFVVPGLAGVVADAVLLAANVPLRVPCELKTMITLVYDDESEVRVTVEKIA